MENSIFKDRIFWLLLIFASIYILGNIGTGSLTTWDETIYAVISRNITETGNWAVLYDQGKPWFEKPPLYMWLTALFYKVLGINELAIRLPSGIFGISTVILIYIFVKRILNKNAAILASLILLAMPHFLHFAKMGMMDVTVTFFITLMLCLFWIGQEDSRYLFFSGLVLFLGYLTKGFAAFLGLFIIITYCIFSKNLQYLLKRQFIWGILLSLAIILTWHLMQYYLGGKEVIKSYFVFHIYERATKAIEGHTGGINFYQKAIFNKNKPWSVLMYVSAIYMLWLFIKQKDNRAVLLISWIVVSYILYTAVKTKLHWYIMPIYPALAISSAFFLNRFIKDKAFKLCLALILIIMLIQVPLSWAFKVDFCPDLKNTAGFVKELYNKGARLYFVGEYDNKEVFYLGPFLTFISKEDVLPKKTSTANKVYFIIKSTSLKNAKEEYRCVFEPVKYFGDNVIVRMK